MKSAGRVERINEDHPPTMTRVGESPRSRWQDCIEMDIGKIQLEVEGERGGGGRKFRKIRNLV